LIDQIISIDPSLKSTGIYIKSGNASFSMAIKGNKHKRDSVLNIRTWIRKYINDFPITTAIVEDYAYAIQNSRSITTLAEVKGVILSELYARNINIIIMPIQTWKTVMGVPSMKKNADYVKYFKKIYALNDKYFKTADEIDAYLMYLCTIKLEKWAVTETQIKIQEKIKKALIDKKENDAYGKN